MSDALSRIVPYFAAFSEGVERCRSGDTFNPADWQDAYNRLNRLRDRYIHEKPNLDPSEYLALRKVFEDDPFIRGLLDIRQVGEHVQKRTGPVIRHPTNAPISLSVETSALAFFSDPIVHLTDTTGQLHRTDHLSNLEQAENRIRRALNRIATNP